MEGVEEATRAAVENCHRVLNLLTEGQDHPLACKNLMEETGEAISSFNKVVSMLSNDVGHAKLRRLKNPQQLQFNRSIFLDRTAVVSRADLSPLLLQLLPRDLSQKPTIDFNCTAKIASPTPSRMLPDKPGVEMETASKSSVQVAFSNHTPAHFHFLHQQHNSQLFQLQQQLKLHNGMYGRSNNSSCTGTVSSSRSFLSSLSMDGSMGGQGFNLIGGSESANPTNWHLHNRRYTGGGDEGSGKCVKKGWCHCSKKRKLRVRRSIKVPAISNKIADIPSDDYSWRKYGQKPIKGSPHPRGYYKCSSLRGCPARKHVERCVEDPTMLIVTYEGEHSHAKLLAQSVHA